MKAQFLREQQLADLRQNIKTNAGRYTSRAPWLEAYFGSANWHLASNIDIADGMALQLPDDSGLSDLENTKRVYGALRHLTPTQAADERLWAYMTHVSHWDYMRKRWPAERYSGDKLPDAIREHYFFMGTGSSRAPVRNGMARLWWYGYATFDESRQDPFELTALMLSRLDIAQTILERAFSHNRQLAREFLEVLLEKEQSGNPLTKREDVRSIAKHLVHIGGVTIVDALNPDELRSIVRRKIDEIQAATS